MSIDRPQAVMGSGHRPGTASAAGRRSPPLHAPLGILTPIMLVKGTYSGEIESRSRPGNCLSGPGNAISWELTYLFTRLQPVTPCFLKHVNLHILMLMCESLRLIISGLHCEAVKLKAIIKRSEAKSSWSYSLTVLHAWCASALSCWKQNCHQQCEIATNICWDSVVKYHNDSVCWLSVLAEKLTWQPISWQTWWTPIVCTSDSWMLCALCWSCLVHTVVLWIKDGLFMTRW